MTVTSFQDFKLCGKQISQSFYYCELIKSPKMVQKCVVYIKENSKMSEKYAFLYIVAILSNNKKMLYTLKAYFKIHMNKIKGSNTARISMCT